MNKNFKRAVQFIFAVEGGLCEDSGGLTKYGISQRAYPSLDIENLSKEQAEQIYYTGYWLPMKCDTYPAYLGAAVFDAAVNHGKHKAAEMLQSATNAFLSDSNRIAVDGIVGPHTLAAIETVGKIYKYEKLYFQFLAKRLSEYVWLAKDEEYAIYLRGWVNRIVKLINFNNQKKVSKS